MPRVLSDPCERRRCCGAGAALGARRLLLSQMYILALGAPLLQLTCSWSSGDCARNRRDAAKG